MTTAQRLLVYIFLFVVFNNMYGQRLFNVEEQQKTAETRFMENVAEIKMLKKSITQITESTNQIINDRQKTTELLGDAHLYIAALENQFISLKEDIKQCDCKK